MKIVVTGALGHIGSGLIRQIPARFPGVDVVMLDNFLTQRYCSLFNLPQGCNYRFMEADILKADLPGCFKGADVVIHLAAVTNAEKSFERKSEVEAINYGGTQRVAEACVNADCPMIFISSTSVYGTQKLVVDEDCSGEDLKPQSPYAETKLKEEELLKLLGQSRGLEYTILRFGTICGVSPGMRFHTAVNKFCWQAVMKQPLTVWTTAYKQKRPYLALDDAIAAFRHVLVRNMFDGRIYNVVTGNHTVEEIVESIRKYVLDLDVKFVDSRIMNQLSYEVSTTRFLGTGFKYAGNIQHCIRETVELLKNAAARVTYA